MTITELLAINNNPESTEEQKQAALASYEEANKPQDTSELESKLTLALESITKLEGKNQELLGEKKAATQKADDAARASMTSDELKADYERRLETQKSELTGSWEGKYNTVLKQLEADRVDGLALSIAAKLSDSPEALLPHIRSRIGFEVGENGFEDFIKGQDGTRTATTREELEKEIAETPYLKGVLKSSFSNPGTTEVVNKSTAQSESPAVQNYLSAMNK